MNALKDILDSSFRRLTCAMAAQGDDADNLLPAARDVVRQLIECLSTGGIISPAPLYEAGLDEQEVADVLRTLVFECIEVLRKELEFSEGKGAFNEAVLAVRACLSPAIPHAPVPEEDRLFFEQLLAEDCETCDPVYGHLIQLFNGLTHVARDLVYVHDLNGRFLYMNRPGLELLNFRTEDLVAGLSVFDLVVPALADLIEARLQAPGTISRTPYNAEICSRDGDLIPVELTTQCLKRGARVVGVLGIAHDLRLARRVESELHRANKLLDKFMEHAPIGVLVTDNHYTVVDANPAAVEILGAPGVSSVIGSSVPALCECDASPLEELLLSALAVHEDTHMRLVQTTVFGATINCDITAVPLKSESDTTGGLLLMLADVSNQVALQESLIQSEKLSAIGEIVAGVAHELNNPLTGILGYAQLLSAAQSDPILRSRLAHIMTEAERCRRIVQNLLSFARRHESERSPQDVNELVQTVLSLREYQLRVDGIAINTEFDDDLPKIMADPHELERVFLNLINNAQQALTDVTDRERCIGIRTCAHERSIHVVFSDNGPGIPANVQSRIFDPFFTTKGVGQGTGLGLSVSYGVIRSHGGKISIESKEGEGATFTIVLPITDLTAQEDLVTD